MNRITKWVVALAFSFVLVFSSASNSAELDEHLSFLEPLIGTNWEGGYTGEDAPDLVITLRFELILDGKVVKYSRAAASA